MVKLNALVCDPVDQIMLDGFEKMGINTVYAPMITKEELVTQIQLYNIVVVRSRTKLTENIIKQANNLKIIARAGIGTDNIDLKASEFMGVEVVTAAGSSTQSVAELNVALAVSLARSIPKLSSNTKKSEWKKETGLELFEKTAGIIGFGRIGLSTGFILSAMGMKVIAYDIYEDYDRAKKVGGEYTSLDDLIENSDVIFVLATLSDNGSGMLGKSHFDRMKKGALIVNTSRSEFINGKDLLTALKSGNVGGYAADVAWNEPPKESWELELMALDNVIITPHIGAQTKEAQKRVAEFTLNNLKKKMEEMKL